MPDENDLVYTTYGIDIERLFEFLAGLITGGAGNTDAIASFFLGVWRVYSVVAFVLSAAFLFGIIYAKIRRAQLVEIESKELHEAEEAFARKHAERSDNTRWRDALAHVESDNPNDWRLAIIEADIMLEEVLNSLGYPGLTIGDKLKQANPQSFRTIDEAWKAHKVRNDIAHRGTDFVLTKRMARETLERYQRVFEEFSLV